MMTLPILVSHILRHGVFEWGRPHVPHTTRGEVRHYFMSQGFKKMNMIKSQTLFLKLSCICNFRFSVDRARFYGAEIACALRFLHKNGIVYR